ncbi:NADH dehydrogenase [ubiquinone] 1 beta subcomplex subunit 5, mitochondrial [Dendroctonus ponderosae]
MTLLSKIRPLLRSWTAGQKLAVQRQMSEHRVFPMQPSKWNWTIFKDMFNFYLVLGAIPCALFTIYMNLFVGPATLTPIPEGYTPKYWEYYRNPITRFLIRYIHHSPQQDYEKFLTYLHVEQEKIMLRKLENEIMNKMKERNDYQAYYYQPIVAKYYRATREYSELIENLDDPLPNDR